MSPKEDFFWIRVLLVPAFLQDASSEWKLFSDPLNLAYCHTRLGLVLFLFLWLSRSFFTPISLSFSELVEFNFLRRISIIKMCVLLFWNEYVMCRICQTNIYQTWTKTYFSFQSARKKKDLLTGVFLQTFTWQIVFPA